jgi:hypothetical protein
MSDTSSSDRDIETNLEINPFREPSSYRLKPFRFIVVVFWPEIAQYISAEIRYRGTPNPDTLVATAILLRLIDANPTPPALPTSSFSGIRWKCRGLLQFGLSRFSRGCEDTVTVAPKQTMVFAGVGLSYFLLFQQIAANDDGYGGNT